MAPRIVIVGGGMAGMSCALHLTQHSVTHKLITDQLGGRIQYDRDLHANFGAFFVMESYKWAQEVVQRDVRLDPTDTSFVQPDGSVIAAKSFRMALLLPQMFKVARVIDKFSKHYESFKTRCLTMPFHVAASSDPFISRLVSLPAKQFAKEAGIERAIATIVGNFVYSCTGVGVADINTLDFLNVCLALRQPIYKFIFDLPGMESRLNNSLVYDSIDSLQRDGNVSTLKMRSGVTYEADILVLATPASVTQRLLGIPEIRRVSKVYTYYLEGKVKQKFTHTGTNVFHQGYDIIATTKMAGNTLMLYTCKPKTDFSEVCESSRVLKMVPFEKAMYVSGNVLLAQDYAANILIAGDHNGLGLEPTAISGIYAANRIVSALARRTPATAKIALSTP
jgi:hypothetical protein